MAEKLFDDHAAVTVRDAEIHILHHGTQALDTMPVHLTQADIAQCASWNGGKGCIFYHQEGCVAREQQGLDIVLGTVYEAKESMKALLFKKGKKGNVAMSPQFRDKWLRNRTLEKLIARGQLPIRYDRNRTISVYCPTRTFVGCVKVSDDTA